MGTESLRVAIAGATSLRGKDLKEYIEESGFPAAEIRLFDEDLTAGTLTDVAGEPAVVQPVEESSFERLRFVFFTGNPAFAVKNAPAAERAGATVIDLTGALAGHSGARHWIPQLDALIGVPSSSPQKGSRVSLCEAPSAASIVACSLSAALREFSPSRLALVFFLPVSERGQAGVEELESQTTRLLLMQGLPQQVFDTQVAFTLMDRWGASSAAKMSDVRAGVDREVRGVLDGRFALPAITFIQTPVFFGQAFSAYAEFSVPPDVQAVTARLQAAGFDLQSGAEPEPTNSSVAGGAQAVLRVPENDPGVPGGFWFWGAADDLRVASANAIRIAERLLAS